MIKVPLLNKNGPYFKKNLAIYNIIENTPFFHLYKQKHTPFLNLQLNKNVVTFVKKIFQATLSSSKYNWGLVLFTKSVWSMTVTLFFF